MGSDDILSSDELSSDVNGSVVAEERDAYDELGPMCPQTALTVIPVPVATVLAVQPSLSEVALAIVKEDARYRSLSRREKAKEMDMAVDAILALDPEYNATLERIIGLMQDRRRAIDEKYGPLPEFKIPKCKGYGCELAWVLTVLTGGEP